MPDGFSKIKKCQNFYPLLSSYETQIRSGCETEEQIYKISRKDYVTKNFHSIIFSHTKHHEITFPPNTSRF